jgi:hypothetical protein
MSKEKNCGTGACTTPTPPSCLDVCRCISVASPNKTIRVARHGCRFEYEVNKGLIGDATKIISGDGIHITGTGLDITPYIISNVGVLSVNGQVGDITINADVAGIDIDATDYIYDLQLALVPGGIIATLTEEYRTGSVKVYFNGIRLTPGQDYDYIELTADTVKIFTPAQDLDDINITIDYKKDI